MEKQKKRETYRPDAACCDGRGEESFFSCEGARYKIFTPCNKEKKACLRSFLFLFLFLFFFFGFLFERSFFALHEGGRTRGSKSRGGTTFLIGVLPIFLLPYQKGPSTRHLCRRSPTQTHWPHPFPSTRSHQRQEHHHLLRRSRGAKPTRCRAGGDRLLDFSLVLLLLPLLLSFLVVGRKNTAVVFGSYESHGATTLESTAGQLE